MVSEREAAAALAAVARQQERTHRAVRLPWWVYLVMFGLVTVVTAVNDFVALSGAKVLAGVVLTLLVIVLVANFVGRSAPISQARGVQGRQVFHPRVFLVAGWSRGTAPGWRGASPTPSACPATRRPCSASSADWSAPGCSRCRNS
jgi:hypothetical protein